MPPPPHLLLEMLCSPRLTTRFTAPSTQCIAVMAYLSSSSSSPSTRVPVCCWSPCSGAQIPASCVLACYWSMAVCYWGSSQSQTTTQLAGIWVPLHWDQQHTGTLVTCEILFVALIAAAVELSVWLTPLIRTMCKYFWPEIKNTDDRMMRQGSSTNEPPTTIVFYVFRKKMFYGEVHN